MSVRPKVPMQGTIAAHAAFLMLLGWHAAPALAAPDHNILCDKSHAATLEVSSKELAVTTVSHELSNAAGDKISVLSADHLLKADLEATVREVFADSEEQHDGQDDVAADTEETVLMKTQVPGISEDELARFRRQMLRKDI